MKRVIKRLYARWITRYWPVRDNLRGSRSSPHPLRAHRGILQHIGRSSEWKKNVLRCSGTPRISGKLFTGLSVGRTAALCIIVIQTGRQTHAHTPAAQWAHHSPSVPCRGEKKKNSVSRPVSAAPPPQALRSRFYSRGCCPRRAVPSCFGVNPTGCPVHSALQGRRGLTSSRQRLSGDQWELRKRSPPPKHPP